jgi:cytochrome bd ubiquinol oxidase subunit II
MGIDVVPLAFALTGLAFYTVLGGADFGTGWWQLTARGDARGARLRSHAAHAIGPVWEANHVWLVFVLTVVWTAYPTFFGSVASTLSVPLFVAAVGIILRGTAYAVRSAGGAPRQVDTLFSLSSVLTPFALGTAVGGIASRRVPVGNAAGDLVTSWLNPTSVAVGVLAVAAAAYLAAVFLSGDATRIGDVELAEAFRVRALVAGIAAGAAALGAIVVVRYDARPLFDGLVEGGGLAALAVSLIAGIATLALVGRRRYEPARYTAALAVAAIIAGWALAQSPLLLPDLTIHDAAAPHDTLVAVVVAVLAGGALVFPSLALLFRLVLRGTFDPSTGTPPPTAAGVVRASAGRMQGRLAAATLVAGIGFTTVADAGWAHAVGATCLLAFVALAFPAALPADERAT